MEMPIKATLIIGFFSNRILDGVLDNFQACLEQGIRHQVIPFHVENQKLEGKIQSLGDS
ncbi:hypothetical protein RvY_03972 [Ramazzottius varieornatus]|uniref:Uncharacterized protein n=1 Tax=Ramazzottius varieornatus TaxID=947166 RepID=A0A1D1UPX7_RAMVA|nr:hypothetical protein RvY_03972 [Ramazzottius varieornatus]